MCILKGTTPSRGQYQTWDPFILKELSLLGHDSKRFADNSNLLDREYIVCMKRCISFFTWPESATNAKGAERLEVIGE